MRRARRKVDRVGAQGRSRCSFARRVRAAPGAPGAPIGAASRATPTGRVLSGLLAGAGGECCGDRGIGRNVNLPTGPRRHWWHRPRGQPAVSWRTGWLSAYAHVDRQRPSSSTAAAQAELEQRHPRLPGTSAARAPSLSASMPGATPASAGPAVERLEAPKRRPGRRRECPVDRLDASGSRAATRARASPAQTRTCRRAGRPGRRLRAERWRMVSLSLCRREVRLRRHGRIGVRLRSVFARPAARRIRHGGQICLLCPAATEATPNEEATMWERRSMGALAAGAAIGLAMQAAEAAEELTLYCSPQIEWCQVMVEEFQKATGIGVAMTRKSSGETFAQVKAEAAEPEGRRLVGRHRRSASAGRRGRADRGVPVADAGRAARLGAEPGRGVRPQDGRHLRRRARHRLQQGAARAEGRAGAEVLEGPRRPGLQGRDPDRQPELVGHRLHHARDARADLRRGRGLRAASRRSTRTSTSTPSRARRRSRPPRRARP